MRRYDHRLIQYVQRTGNVGRVVCAGVPGSTVHGWLAQPPIKVENAGLFSDREDALEIRIAHLEENVQRLRALLALTVAVLRVCRPDFSRLRVGGMDKRRLLRALDRSRNVVGLKRVLTYFGISPSRLSAWRARAKGCDLEDHPSCPGNMPQRVTTGEILAMREFATSPAYRHVPTGRFAILAQRMGKVFASTTTWYRLLRERGWWRLRLRLHPPKPTAGIRATDPNALWHVDMTLIRLLDSTKAYLHAIIDNYSRRILAWQLKPRFDPGTTADLIVHAVKHVPVGHAAPELLVDGGVENFNKRVDALVERNTIRRVLAQVDISFSNSMIEAWWRQLKHQWLFLNQLDNIRRVQRLVAFYVREHNGVIPHSAFKGQTPDEIYFGTGDVVPIELKKAKERARRERLEANRALSCSRCT